LALILSALLVSACQPLGIGRNDYDPEEFRHAIANAQEDGMAVYWLGREFSAGGVTFDGIESHRKESDGSPVGALPLHYYPTRGGEAGHLDVITFTKAEWEEVSARVYSPASVTVKRSPVVISGRDAELIFGQLDARTVNSMDVVIPFDDFVVLASTRRYYGSGNNQVNPVFDKDVFLQTLEELRPYPE
jgi:hypothetical protein